MRPCDFVPFQPFLDASVTWNEYLLESAQGLANLSKIELTSALKLPLSFGDLYLESKASKNQEKLFKNDDDYKRNSLQSINNIVLGLNYLSKSISNLLSRRN